MPFDDGDRPGRGRGTSERAINLPPAVLWLIGINVAVQLVRQLLGEQADQDIILQFGLIPSPIRLTQTTISFRSSWHPSPTSSCMADGCISASTC